MNERPQQDFLIMGVVNITPDSFSDGGQWMETGRALDHCQDLVDQGADILDLGAESTRPGAKALSWQDEWSRLEPVLQGLRERKLDVPVSVDTYKDRVALQALAYDIKYINNINGLYSGDTLRQLAAVQGLTYVAMHKQGKPETMQDEPLAARGVVEQVSRFFQLTKQQLLLAGFSEAQIYLDPGIGFGKTDGANLRLIAETMAFAREFQLALGVSRKSWIGRSLAIEDPLERDKPSKMIEIAVAMMGAKIIRTHDVATLAKLRRTWQEDEKA